MVQLKNIEIYPSREKVSGRMWGGSAEAEINGHKLKYKLWHHGSNNETIESLTPEFSLEAIDGKSAGWHSKHIDGSLYFHEQGWFMDNNLREITKTKITAEQATKLGFIKIY